jgi:hypothetical protein
MLLRRINYNIEGTNQMSSRKTKIRKQKRPELLSDDGQLPGYRVEDFVDILKLARRKFDKLCEFSWDELEDGTSDDQDCEIDWVAKREKAIKKLDRWSCLSFAALHELFKLIHDVRDTQELLQVCSVDHAAKEQVRSKRSKSELRKLR